MRSRSAAKWRYVNRTCPERKSFRSLGSGSFTFTIMSASEKIASGPSWSVAPAAVYSASESPEPMPAPFFHNHLVTVVDEFGHGGRHQPDAILMVFNFLRHPDLHVGILVRAGAS